MEDRLGKTEATDSEANPEETESVAVHEDAPKEEVVAETFGTLKKQHGFLHLAEGADAGQWWVPSPAEG
jgi:hypothetical protein